MKNKIRNLLGCLFMFLTGIITSQTRTTNLQKVFKFEEYLGYVKRYHPLLKQANLTLSIGEANLLKARGGFDPKIDVDYDRKKFKGTEYFDQLNATFKIPTWYGIEFKANFEENTGDFLNPSLTLPEDGLYSAGISLSLAQGFIINDRMAMLKKAKLFREQTKVDRDLLINELLFEASKAYFKWLEATNEQDIHDRFLSNARERFDGVKRGVVEGENAVIDSVEAKIIVLGRQLNYEAAKLKRRKTALYLSNFLWLNDIPLELQENAVPEMPSNQQLRSVLILDRDTALTNVLIEHPKMESLAYKIKGLSVDRSLKRNKLLPKLDLQYNFLSSNYDQLNTFNTNNYKAMLNISMPIFLRKERGDLKLASLKLKEAKFERLSTELSLQNKISSVNVEISSLSRQHRLAQVMVKDYEILVKAEERKFSLGESSLFLINTREKSLIQTQLKENILNVKRLTANSSLFHAMGIIQTENIE